MNEPQHLTVTALTKYLKMKFDRDPHLRQVLVKGEISNFKHHSRGHMYFTLKDNGARILAVMFHNQNRSLPFQPEDGLKVLVEGEISLFEQSGQYQIYIQRMQPDGVGSLYLAFQQLKERLQKEGLFAPQYKKPIPMFPKTVGLITSPTGAAVRDMITTIRRRHPMTRLLIYPTIVQGDNAVSSIVRNIRRANEDGTCDTLIVGRGGGSIEELWAFNEEAVARAIFQSQIPVISAVGHETDTTIADWVADMRAPTPTAAAELAVPNDRDLLHRIETLEKQLKKGMYDCVQEGMKRLEAVQRSYAFRYPATLVKEREQQLDALLERLRRNVERTTERKEKQYTDVRYRLLQANPRAIAERSREQHTVLTTRLQNVMMLTLQRKEASFQQTIRSLELLNPLAQMQRGYSIVKNEANHVVTSVTDLKKDDVLRVQMKDGNVTVQVQAVEQKMMNGDE